MNTRPYTRKSLYITFFVLLLSFLHVSESVAGLIGNPDASGTPDRFSRYSLDFDQIEVDIRSGQSAFEGKSTIERILLSGTYGITPHLDGTLRIGISDFDTPSRNFNGNFGPALGTGVRWTYYKKGDLHLSLGSQVLIFLSRDINGPIPRLRYQEIESFAGATLTGLERFTSYFGVLLSKGFGRFKKGPTIRTKDLFGIFFGGEFQIYKQYYIVGEARIVHENSLTLSLAFHP